MVKEGPTSELSQNPRETAPHLTASSVPPVRLTGQPGVPAPEKSCASRRRAGGNRGAGMGRDPSPKLSTAPRAVSTCGCVRGFGSDRGHVCALTPRVREASQRPRPGPGPGRRAGSAVGVPRSGDWGLGQPVVRIPEGRGRGLGIWAGECPPNREKEGSRGWRARELGKVDPHRICRPHPCGSRACLAAGLLSTSWPCAPQRSEFLPGPRRESAETGAHPGGSTDGPRR